ncbi:MAG TPA: WYL domain-containing protein [Acidimicrobiales bacterium]|nr:WYL domain-containing protein [Acidimicrobiales bacterium]
MGRSDRLYALVDELRARAPRVVPRHELAARLEVSARTVERDILTLQQAGVPIWTQRGRLGGYAIEQDTTLPPLNLEATEALAVMAALSVLPNHPFAAAGRRAQHKLLAAMRQSDVDKTQELAARIRTVRPDGPRPDGDVVRNIERAVVGRRVVDLVYGDRKGSSSARPVEAHGLHLTSRAGYLIGWCRLRDAGRAFRLDRIQQAVVRDEVAPERDLDPMLDWVEGAATIDPAAPAARNASDPPTPPDRHGPPAWLRRNEPAPDPAIVGPAADRLRALVAGLPDVEEHDHHGGPAWRHPASEATFAAIQDDGRLWLEATHAEVAARTATSPDVYERHYGLSVRLDRVDHPELRRLVVAAYRVATLRSDSGVTWTDVTALDPGAERSEDGRLRHRTTPDVAAALVLADPLTFGPAPGATEAGTVLVDLDLIDPPRLRRLLEGATRPC